ncbi:proline--tRNA ligase [bacterium]|nr:proline--tRNA ligase [bacterium]
MRYSQFFIPTLKENPAEAEVISHQLMVRAGMIRKTAAGIYDVLPLGLRVFRKVEAIVREEMNRAGALEVLVPVIQPAELWQESGRWQKYGAELLRIKDRHEREFCFSPTAEEVITNIVRRDVRSYRELPVNLYQINTKFRDEIRPRFGLMRGREFIMKDAYSFDANDAGADESYEKMRVAYHRIFRRFGFRFRAVEADSGTIGGSFSSEFMVLADTGESVVVSCEACDFAANIEKAVTHRASAPASREEPKALETVATPNMKSIEEIAGFLSVAPARCIKTLIYIADGETVAVLVRGDREVNEIKLKNLLDADEVALADPETTEKATGAPVGFAGPVGLAVKTIADYEIERVENGVTGANKADAHHVNVNPGRDFTPTLYADIRDAAAGDPCPRCEGGKLRVDRGIEVGHIFKLGTNYSAAMGCVVQLETGEQAPAVMGCYGLGIGRTAAASIEQNHDENGIVWPIPIAPFSVIVTAINPKGEVAGAAERLYSELLDAGIDVLYDDRDERAGVKFKDADLLGIPLRVNVGAKGLADGVVELKFRAKPDEAPERVPVGEIAARLVAIVEDALRPPVSTDIPKPPV